MGLLRRATVPRTQPSAGQWNSTARPRRAEPVVTSGGVTRRNPALGRDLRERRGGGPPGADTEAAGGAADGPALVAAPARGRCFVLRVGQ